MAAIHSQAASPADPARTPLQRLLAPRALAYVGGRSMARAAQRCARDFAGPVNLVNPDHEELEGLRCWRRVQDLPTVPDGVFLGVNAAQTLGLVEQLQAIGAGGAVCYASGFAEAGADGARLQADLVRAAGSMALIGPNCYGLVDALHGASLWPVAHGARRVESGVALLTQSGNAAYNLSMCADEIDIAYLISVGNQAQQDVAALIDALLDEPRVTAIGLHLEGLTQPQRFAAAAQKALERGVPLIALKAGVSAKGAALALGHTSALAGSDTVYDALFKRLGVIRVDGVASLLETLKIASLRSRPRSTAVYGLACSGGDAEFIADHAEAAGLELPALAPATRQTLSALLPSFANVDNPLDFTTAIWGNEAALSELIDAVMAQADDASLLLALDFPSEESGERAPCEALAELFARKVLASGRSALVASVFPALLPPALARSLRARGIAAVAGLQQGLAAWGRIAHYALARQRLLEQPPAPLLPPPPRREGGQRKVLLDEWQSRRLLAPHGVPFGPARVCAPGEAAGVAADMAFPLVLKVVSAALPHKSDVGGVALNLGHVVAVDEAVATMRARLAASAPEVAWTQVLVEPMAAPAVAELMVGVRREPGIGLCLVLAVGGTLVELLRDSRTLLLPVQEHEVREALASLKMAPLLGGWRGKPAADLDAAIAAIVGVARCAIELGERLVELEVNPLLLHARACTAVDALITLNEEIV